MNYKKLPDSDRKRVHRLKVSEYQEIMANDPKSL